MAAVCTFIASAAEIQFFNGKKGRQTLNGSILHDLGADVKLFSERLPLPAGWFKACRIERRITVSRVSSGFVRFVVAKPDAWTTKQTKQSREILRIQDAVSSAGFGDGESNKLKFVGRGH